MHQLVPIAAPATGCRKLDIVSGLRRNVIGVCVQPYEARAVEETVGPPGWAHIVAKAAAPGVHFGQGALLMVTPLGPESPLAQAFEFDAQSGQVRVVGADLCIGTPPDDQTAGAPLLLRPCAQAAPMMFRSANR